MATPYNTSNMRIYWDPAGGTSLVLVTKVIDCSVQLTKEMKDSSTKDDGATKNFAPSFSSATGTMSGLHAKESNNAKDLADKLLAGTKVTIRYSTETMGDDYLEFSAYLDNVEYSSPGIEGDTAFTASFVSTGTITSGSVS